MLNAYLKGMGIRNCYTNVSYENLESIWDKNPIWIRFKIIDYSLDNKYLEINEINQSGFFSFC